jgi:hypothetical protein
MEQHNNKPTNININKIKVRVTLKGKGIRKGELKLWLKW